MLKFISSIVYVVVGIVAAVIAKTALSHYFVEGKEKIKKYESLLDKGLSTTAKKDSAYTVKSIRIKELNLKIYKIGYEYQVQNKKYRGEYIVENPDTTFSEFLPILYLKSNPEVHSINAKKELKEAKEELQSGFSLEMGVISAIVSVLFTLLGLNNIRDKLNSIFTATE